MVLWSTHHSQIPPTQVSVFIDEKCLLFGWKGIKVFLQVEVGKVIFYPDG